MKKIISFIAAGFIFALTPGAATAAENKAPKLVDLKAAVAEALEYDKTDKIKNIDIRLKTTETENAVKNAQYPDREQAVYDQYKVLSIPAKQIWKEIIPLEKQFEVDKLVKEKEEADEQLAGDVTYAYFNALINTEKAKLSEDELNMAEKELELARERFRLGQLSEIALKEAELTFESAELFHAAALDDRDYSMDDLAAFLGMPGSGLALVNEDLIQKELPEYSKNTFVEQMKKNDSIYVNAEKELEFKKKRYDIYIEVTRYGVGKETYEADKAYITAEVNLRKTEKAEIIQMYSEYIDLLNMKGDLEVSGEKLKVAGDNVAQQQNRYEKGMITETELNKERINYRKLELEQLQKLNDFNSRTDKLMMKLK